MGTGPFSAKELHEFAARQLGPFAQSACLPLVLLEKYALKYPEGLKCVSDSSGLCGFYLLVPLTPDQSAGLLKGEIKNGFELANLQEVNAPVQFSTGHPTSYYLMGIYGSDVGKSLIKEEFECFVRSMEAPAYVFAKGTTEKGKAWMLHRGFVPVAALSPISVLTVRNSASGCLAALS